MKTLYFISQLKFAQHIKNLMEVLGKIYSSKANKKPTETDGTLRYIVKFLNCNCNE